ncbi:MAG: hypothetical protein NUV65_06130 [Candidatus Roizmanbacteria bacterium]|nr:hypothetical protein [Candidatus Roizmanbacteria bacterium]
MKINDESTRELGWMFKEDESKLPPGLYHRLEVRLSNKATGDHFDPNLMTLPVTADGYKSGQLKITPATDRVSPKSALPGIVRLTDAIGKNVDIFTFGTAIALEKIDLADENETKNRRVTLSSCAPMFEVVPHTPEQFFATHFALMVARKSPEFGLTNHDPRCYVLNPQEACAGAIKSLMQHGLVYGIDEARLLSFIHKLIDANGIPIEKSFETMVDDRWINS